MKRKLLALATIITAITATSTIVQAYEQAYEPPEPPPPQVSSQTSQVQSSMAFLNQRHHVSITVDCMETALIQMTALPGTELFSNINITQGYGTARRNVQAEQLPQALNRLESIGVVTTASSSATNLFRDWSDISNEMRVREREYNRLVSLLYEAETLAQFGTIERHLLEAIGIAEGLRGQLMHLQQQMGMAEILITLALYQPNYQAYEPYEPYEPETTPIYYEETPPNPILEALLRSLGWLETFALFIARILLPTLLFLAVGITLYKLGKKLFEKLPQKEGTPS